MYSEGIGYTFGRVPMGSTDFSLRLYSYDDVENDMQLQHFKLADEDNKYKVKVTVFASFNRKSSL